MGSLLKQKNLKIYEFQLLKKLRRVNHKMQVVFIAVAELLLRYEDGKMAWNLTSHKNLII